MKHDDVEPIRFVMKQALKRKWRHLAEERIENVTHKIPLGRKFWALTKAERQEIERIFRDEETHKLVTCLKGRSDEAEVRVLDAAYWLKGCSSLGRLRFAVLVGMGRGAAEGVCLMDIKEASKAAAPRSATMATPRSNAERIVTGAKALSPFLGERMMATQFEDRSAVLRELMPQDLKFEMNRLSQEEAIATSSLLASVVGRAHGRQMNRKTREGWVKELSRSRSKTMDAPSWIWSSVLELVASHEAAYLDHCRLYALDKDVA